MTDNDHIVVRFDWYDATESAITDILALNARTMNDGSAKWESVAICLGEKAVVISVDPNTDQLWVDHAPAPGGTGWRSISSFTFVHGRELGWSWVGTNCQGYHDSFTVAFGKDVTDGVLTPRCMFLGEGSEIACMDLTARRSE